MAVFEGSVSQREDMVGRRGLQPPDKPGFYPTRPDYLPFHAMAIPSRATATSVLRRLREDRPLAAVELRPPRTGLSGAETMEVWIDMYHSIQRLARRDTIMFLTDNAVGLSEEEN